jgi:Rrf2 family protein
MLTRKGKYGLKALMHLTGLPPGGSASSAEIAEKNQISKKFLDGILGELRNAGLVHSRYGREGGFMLARPASEIMVGHIVRVLDGPLAPIPCASRSYYQKCNDCVNENRCAVRLIMLDVRNAVAAILDKRSLAEMRGLGEPALRKTGKRAAARK